MRKTNLLIVSIVLLAAFFCAATSVASAYITLSDKYVGLDKVDLSWTRYDGGDFREYKIYMDGGYIFGTGNQDRTWYLDDGLQTDRSYTYRVDVINTTGAVVAHSTKAIRTGDVHGTISYFDETWSGTNVMLTGDVILNPGFGADITFTIEECNVFPESVGPKITQKSGDGVSRLDASDTWFTNVSITLGWNDNIICDCNSNKIITITGHDNFITSNHLQGGLKIDGGDGNRIRHNALKEKGISITGVFTPDGNEIYNNTIRDLFGYASHGLYIKNGDYSVIEKNTIINCRGKGIYLDGSVYGVKIEDNTVELNGEDGYWAPGINIRGGENNIITGNTVRDNWGHGMQLGAMKNTSVLRNNVSENGNNGIEIGGEDNNISDNLCSGNGWSGLEICGKNSIVSSNRIIDNQDGIDCHRVDNVTIAQNTVSDNRGEYGICLYDSFGSNISGNELSNNTHPEYGSEYEYGSIYLHDSEEVTVSHNNISQSKYGVYVREGEYHMIDSNRIFNCSYGVYVMIPNNFRYSTWLNIISNNISGSGDNGIYIEYGANNTISNNTLSSCDKGINIAQYSNDNMIYANTALKNHIGLVIQSSSCYDNKIENNTARSNGYGIQVSGTNCTVVNNTVISNDDVGMWVAGRKNRIMSNTITANTIDSNRYFGMWVIWGKENVISDNSIEEFEHGICLESTEQNIIRSNTIEKNNQSGILFRWAADNNTFEKNIIVRDTTNDESWGIILEWDDSVDNEFSENTFGSKHPTTVSLYDYFGTFKIRGVEDPPESPKPPEYPTTFQNISNYVEMQNLSANTTLFLDFHYEDKDVKDINEETLKVWKHNGTAWVEDSWNGTRKLDTANNIVGVEVKKFCIFAPLAGLPVHNIDTGEDFNTIQEAIDDPDTKDGHTITVDPAYTEAETKENIVVNKKLTIESTSGDPSDTIIEAADEWKHAIEVVADDVTIQDFTIKGATYKQGVKVDGQEIVNIKYCDIRDNYFGVGLDMDAGNTPSSYCNIENCEFSSNTNGGVYINQSSNNTVFGCTFEDKYGVVVDRGTENTIWENTFTNNAELAIYVFNSNKNSIEGNQIMNTKIGMLIENTEENEIGENIIGNANECGVKLFSGRNNSIKSNQITNAKIGMLIENTEENEISENIIEDANECGIKLEDSTNNVLSTIEISSTTPTGFYLLHSDDNTIEKCSVSANECGIKLEYSSNNLMSTILVSSTPTGFYLLHSDDNTIAECGVNGSVPGDIMGIDLRDSKRNIITECTIYDLSTIGYSATGIRMFSGSTHNMILDSTIYNLDSSESEGIDVGSPLNVFDDVTIATIISRGNSSEGKGIDVWAYANSSIFSNVKISDVRAKNNSFGFYLYQNNYNEIESCTITGVSADYNNAHGLHLNRSNSTTIANTTLKWINAASNDSAILIEGTDGTNIFDNVTLGAVYPTSFSLGYSGDIEIDEVDFAPEDPANGKNISKYMAMTNRSNAWADLMVFYNDSELGGVDENSLRMWKHDGEWAEVPPPNGVNTVENYVYANITSFSIFAPLGNVSVAAPPNITSFAPPSPVNDTICTWRTFNVTVNQTVNVSWYLNDSLLFKNVSVTEANYSLHAEFVGDNNVSAVASNANGTDRQTWIWNITGVPPVVPPAPTVIQPNGGEEIPGGSVYDIKWSVTKGTYDLAANPITIGYSTNNGGSWTQIATNEPNDGRYSWNVPNINPSSSNCVVKVEAKDVQGNKGDDTSDSVFTITRTTSSETETIPAGGTGTVEGPPESNTTAEVTTEPGKSVDVTVAYYDENPHPGAPKPAEMLDKYVDISVSDKDNVKWPIYVEMHYTDDEIAGLDESSLGLYHYKNGAWHRCNNTGVNVDENYVWAYVAKDECAGSPFGSGGSSQPIPVPEFNAIGLLAFIGISSVVLAFTMLRKRK